MSLLDNMPHTCTAKRRRRIGDGMGGSLDTTPTTLFTDKKCWRQPAGDSETIQWMQRSIDVTHRVFFSSDPSLDEGCVLTFGDDTVELEVMSHSELDDSVGLGYLWRVMCRKLRLSSEV